MDITLYISRFLYRIRYQLIVGTFIVTALVAYFTQFMAKTYTVNTSIYTGITSSSGLEDNERQDWQSINNTFDNIVNLTKSKGTLEKVSIKLLAQDLVYGNLYEDNTYITYKNYEALLSKIPDEIKELIVKDSLIKTTNNLIIYQQNAPRGFLYELFNSYSPFYSYDALSKIEIKRLGNSDLIDISYKSTDPGITLNTVKLVSEELRLSYEGLRYKTTNDIISYYQNELNKLRTQLNKMENDLTNYNIENSIQNIDSKWFEYNELHKKHVLKIDVSFPIGQSEITHIPLEKREELYSAGLAIDQFLKHAEEEYGESVKYLLIIEGQASNDGFTGNFDLSYQRALSLYRYFQINRHLDLKRQNCEVLVCGSGTEGALRAYPDNASNTKNQRFLIHILPKPGVIN